MGSVPHALRFARASSSPAAPWAPPVRHPPRPSPCWRLAAKWPDQVIPQRYLVTKKWIILGWLGLVLEIPCLPQRFEFGDAKNMDLIRPCSLSINDRLLGYKKDQKKTQGPSNKWVPSFEGPCGSWKCQPGASWWVRVNSCSGCGMTIWTIFQSMTYKHIIYVHIYTYDIKQVWNSGQESTNERQRHYQQQQEHLGVHIHYMGDKTALSPKVQLSLYGITPINNS